jgi:putative intracellular protease/amidase
MPNTNRILVVVTNVGEYEKVGYRTGLWLSELTHFLDVVEPAGFQTDIASPSGGYVPIDPESLMLQEAGHALGMGGKVHRRYEDRAFMDRLVNTMKVADANPAAYDAIYMTGGHGVCFDFPKSEALARVTREFYDSGKIVSAVCHGPAGLLEVKLSGGEYLVKGRKMTGFSWTEEEVAKRANGVPFNLEEQLRKRGANYSKGTIPFHRYVVEDGLLVTGQNPASAEGVGKAVLHKLHGVK